jgi:hypothetical protein
MIPGLQQHAVKHIYLNELLQNPEIHHPSYDSTLLSERNPCKLEEKEMQCKKQ